MLLGCRSCRVDHQSRLHSDLVGANSTAGNFSAAGWSSMRGTSRRRVEPSEARSSQIQQLLASDSPASIPQFFSRSKLQTWSPVITMWQYLRMCQSQPRKDHWRSRQQSTPSLSIGIDIYIHLTCHSLCSRAVMYHSSFDCLPYGTRFYFLPLCCYQLYCSVCRKTSLQFVFPNKI